MKKLFMHNTFAAMQHLGYNHVIWRPVFFFLNKAWIFTSLILLWCSFEDVICGTVAATCVYEYLLCNTREMKEY